MKLINEKEKFMEFIKNKKNFPLILILLAGLFIIMLYSFYPKNNTQLKKTEDEFNLSTYIADYEKRMENMLSQIEGAGRCKVTLTVSEGPENIYASESRISVDKKNDSETRQNEKKDSEDKVIIMRDKNGGEKALIQKTVAPKITGAVIICDGADDINISENIINAVSVMLDIKTNKVCVIKKSMD